MGPSPTDRNSSHNPLTQQQEQERERESPPSLRMKLMCIARSAAAAVVAKKDTRPGEGEWETETERERERERESKFCDGRRCCCNFIIVWRLDGCMVASLCVSSGAACASESQLGAHCSEDQKPYRAREAKESI